MYPNFGSFAYFDNSFVFNLDKKLTIETGFGLVKQNYVLTPSWPNYHLVFNALAEYAITPRFGFYAYGQYVTPTINHYKVFEPLIPI
jgi:hypothetical protein